MTTFPRSPRVLKGGVVLLDPTTGALQRLIVLQYNPDTVTRTLQVQGSSGESGDRSEALRLKGPPVETIKLEAEIDAADQLEKPRENETTATLGLQPHLAALETIVYPTAAHLRQADSLALNGAIEITPAESPLTVFVWSKNRVVPVRITDFSITEEAFDPQLNPTRAKVSLSMRVLSSNDLPQGHVGASMFAAYHQQKETLAAMFTGGAASALGVPRF
jgi:hypothetical protein